MPRGSMQKQKLLYLQKILLQKTDERHGLTINEIIAELNRYGISSERKSLYDDLKILEQFGLDVCRIKTNTTRYYVGSRDFEIPELKLLVDSIQSSRFITPKKSLSLIKKLEGLLSEHDGRQLQREVFVSNRIKAGNEKIYYNVDDLHNAINSDVQVTFKYFCWEVNFGSTEKIVWKERKNGAVYRVSPWALVWDDENYYLVAFDESADMIKHYRVDKMDGIALCDEKRKGKEVYEKLNIARYTNSVFSMFGGTETEVTLLVDNSLVGVIADRFGSDVFISKESETSFRVSVKVMLSPQFYAWLFGLGDKVRILSPEGAAEKFSEHLNRILEAYSEQ